MHASNVVVWLKRVVGVRVRMERSVHKALLPYADDMLPAITMFVSRDVLSRSIAESLQHRHVQEEVDEIVRAFTAKFCVRHPHQAPEAEVVILDTIQGVVEARIGEPSHLFAERDAADYRKAIITTPEGGEIAIDCPSELIFGGRFAAAGVTRLNDPTVSARHARIVLRPDSCTIADLGSLNRTRVNDVLCNQEATKLSDGDQIALGDCVLRLALNTASTSHRVRPFVQDEAYARS